MPTKEQINTAAGHIADVIGRNYIEGDGDLCSCWFQPEGGGPVGMTVFQGVPAGTPEPFGRIPEKARIELLDTYVDWEGFDDAQEWAVIRRVLDGKEPGLWMEGIEVNDSRHDDAALKPAGKPRNHGTYQVWHEGRIHALDVESVGAFEVDALTNQPREQWERHPTVTARIDHPRPTRVGDVIVDPTCGAWEVQSDGYLAVTPPQPVAERMAREGIVPQHIELLQAWTKDMLEACSDYERKLEEAAEMAEHRAPDKKTVSPVR